MKKLKYLTIIILLLTLSLVTIKDTKAYEIYEEPKVFMLAKTDGYDYNIDNSISSTSDVCKEKGYIMVTKIVGWVLNIARWVAPILIIVFGLIDAYKAVTAIKDVKLTTMALSMFVRVIAGVFIFLLPGLIQFVFTWVDTFNNNNFSECTKCILTYSEDCGK